MKIMKNPFIVVISFSILFSRVGGGCGYQFKREIQYLLHDWVASFNTNFLIIVLGVHWRWQLAGGVAYMSYHHCTKLEYFKIVFI
jgi:hypothetical protein